MSKLPILALVAMATVSPILIGRVEASGGGWHWARGASIGSTKSEGYVVRHRSDCPRTVIMRRPMKSRIVLICPVLHPSRRSR